MIKFTALLATIFTQVIRNIVLELCYCQLKEICRSIALKISDSSLVVVSMRIIFVSYTADI